MFGIAAILTPCIAFAARRFPPGRRHWLVWTAIHFCGSAAFALLVKVLWDLAMLPIYATPWVTEFSFTALRLSLMQGLQINAALYWIIVMAVTAIDHAERLSSVALEAAELRAQLAEAHLRTLRNRLDPHFLFNALHGISSLVQEDPAAAEEMIADLSELLRRSLDQRERLRIPLSEEMEFLKLYLNIQCRRFVRLRTDFEISRAASAAFVPNMILQPLVENSIRHAISTRRNGGAVAIRAAVAGHDLLIEVEDQGGSPSALPLREGVGLRTTRERLEQMYGGTQRMEFQATASGMLVRLRIPFQFEKADAA